MPGFPLASLTLPSWLVPLLVLLAGALLAHLAAFQVIVRAFTALSVRTRTQWDNIFVKRRVISRLVHLVPATIISYGLPLVLLDQPQLSASLLRLLNLYFIIVGLGVFDGVLNSIGDGYEQYTVSRRVSIRGFLQAFKIVGVIVALVLAVSQVAGKSPAVFLSGIGAFTAILLLIFKDSILGLVAGIQLTSMDLVRKGDWIEMPRHGADGDVIDISLTTVRVRNWDMTISSIPAYELVSSSFRNWRGMSEAGGRRIKRAIAIDLTSIRFLDDNDIRSLRRIRLLAPYLDRKLAEIGEGCATVRCAEDSSLLVNQRHLTNIGTFRAYCQAYLRAHPGVHQALMMLVRQLEPTPRGLPLEVYAFTGDTGWVAHEGIQSDIFDHLLAILPVFDLRPFQEPGGADVRLALGRGGAAEGKLPLAGAGASHADGGTRTP